MHGTYADRTLANEGGSIHQGACVVGEIGTDLVLEAAECPHPAQRSIRLGADVVFQQWGEVRGQGRLAFVFTAAGSVHHR
jgi:hypothetical protein